MVFVSEQENNKIWIHIQKNAVRMNLLVQGLAHSRPSIIVSIVIIIICHDLVFWSVQNQVLMIESNSCNSYINISDFFLEGGWRASDHAKKIVP